MPDSANDEYYQNFTIKTALNTTCTHDNVKQTIREVFTQGTMFFEEQCIPLQQYETSFVKTKKLLSSEPR